MILLHDLMDDILIILFDNDRVDLNVVFQDRYYPRKISYASLALVINHLIDEGFINANGDNTIVSITIKGKEFVASGGYTKKLEEEFEKRSLNESQVSEDSKHYIDRKTYLSFINYPDKTEERKAEANKKLKILLLLTVITIIIHWFLHYSS